MSKRKRKPKQGWQLNTGLFEVFWKRGPRGLYADRIRVCGVTFYYISGKKATKRDERT